jgi:hypothetical protein
MCFDVTNFSKDSVNVRKDLAGLCKRPLMEPKINAKGNLKRTWAPYTQELKKIHEHELEDSRSVPFDVDAVYALGEGTLHGSMSKY